MERERIRGKEREGEVKVHKNTDRSYFRRLNLTKKFNCLVRHLLKCGNMTMTYWILEEKVCYVSSKK